jgi:ketosteroid isomerase-like protein
MTTTAESARAAIREVVERETRAWDTQDIDLLLSVFHPDMVWPWPPTPADHDPLTWELLLGRFDALRWAAVYRELFATYRLVHNRREIRRIAVSAEGDGGLAVVDIDTLWHAADGRSMHWLGRTAKVYTLVQGEWKLIAHTGVLSYPDLEPRAPEPGSASR